MARKPRVSLRSLRTFCVTARHDSFSAAADELFITPSAVSHQIKSLEQELDQVLFERSSRELKLTEVGRGLFEEASPLIDGLQALTEKYAAKKKRPKIRISVQPFFASEFFVPKLSEFTRDHPEIDIEVGTSDESAEKHPADADLSIRLFKTPPASLESTLLFPLRMVPAGSKDFKKSLKVTGKKIESEFPIIVHATRPDAWKNWQKSTGIRIPEDSKVTTLDSMIAVVRAAERGIGAAMVPVPIADQWFRQGTIVRLFRQALVADVSYYLVHEKGRAEDASVRLLKDWIVENFAEDV